jgi:hypothetical protein
MPLKLLTVKETDLQKLVEAVFVNQDGGFFRDALLPVARSKHEIGHQGEQKGHRKARVF